MDADDTPHALELHVARCACGFVVSGRSLTGRIAGIAEHFLAAPGHVSDPEWNHHVVASASSPDPVAAKLLLGSR